ncbi:hypothetical protein [Segatella sp.]
MRMAFIRHQPFGNSQGHDRIIRKRQFRLYPYLLHLILDSLSLM